MFKFPYSDTHTLNLDWLLSEFEKFKKSIKIILPIKKTSAMTQPVGVDDSGKLWTTPGGGAAPVTSVNAKTGAVVLAAVDIGATPPAGQSFLNLQAAVNSFNQSIGNLNYAVDEIDADVAALDADKVDKTDYAPEAKTVAMTQAVGVDGSGKLWTAPGGGEAAVTSVNGETGDVVLTGEDIEITPPTGQSFDNVQDAVDSFNQSIGNLNYTVDEIDADVATLNGDVALLRTGKVNTSDYSPTAKTAAMTQPVGVDGSGKLWTSDVRPVLLYSRGKSAFPAGTIALNLANYEYLAIEFAPTASSNSVRTVLAKKGTTAPMFTVLNLTSAANIYMYYRTVSSTSGGVTFSDGYRRNVTTSDAATQNDDSCNPIRIWGIPAIVPLAMFLGGEE